MKYKARREDGGEELWLANDFLTVKTRTAREPIIYVIPGGYTHDDAQQEAKAFARAREVANAIATLLSDPQEAHHNDQ